MNEPYQSPEQQYFADVNTRLRDIEEKQKLLKDRTLLIGKNLIDDRESLFNELQELKRAVLKMKEDQTRMQEFLKRVSEQISETARKEEVLMLQRQLNIFTESLKHK